MTELEQTVEENRNMIRDLNERVKRLESGGGSGAIACCEGREADEHQAERKDSREDSPGCAGVGEADAKALADKWMELAACTKAIGESPKKQIVEVDLAGFFARMAATYEHCALELLDALPKPDSEARNERSGRRNTQPSDTP